jgi:hypothetical protein
MYWLIGLYTILVILSIVHSIIVTKKTKNRESLVNANNNMHIIKTLTKRQFRKNDGVWVMNTENFNPNIRYYLKRTEDEGENWYLSTKPNGEGFEIPGKVSYNNLSVKAPAICECCKQTVNVQKDYRN